MKDWGFIGINATRRAGFTAAAASGAATAFSSALEEADIDCYKNGSATQRTSTAGFTVTSTFDSLTGGYMLAVDFSDNTDAGFYAAGAELEFWLSPDETLDGVTILAIIAGGVLETLAQQGSRLYNEKVMPNGCVISTVTGNTTSRVNLTDLVDAQTADVSLVGQLWAFCDNDNGQVEHVVITGIVSARLFTVATYPEGAVMDFTVAALDQGWFEGWAAVVPSTFGNTMDDELATFHGAYDMTVAAAPAPTATGFTVDVDNGSLVKQGFVRFTGGALTGAVCPAKHTSTVVTIEGAPLSMPAGWRQFSGTPAAGATLRFFPNA